MKTMRSQWRKELRQLSAIRKVQLRNQGEICKDFERRERRLRRVRLDIVRRMAREESTIMQRISILQGRLLS
jgi:hypothetical protein